MLVKIISPLAIVASLAIPAKTQELPASVEGLIRVLAAEKLCSMVTPPKLLEHLVNESYKNTDVDPFVWSDAVAQLAVEKISAIIRTGTRKQFCAHVLDVYLRYGYVQ